MTTLIINEIFHSIQGESTHTGRPCVFVRLAYCNLRCQWCDTAYAFDEGVPMTVEAILGAVEKTGCRLVEVTGGEPLMQEGVGELFAALCDRGYETLVETGGSLPIEAIDRRVKRIVDFKCPASGMDKKNLWENARHLTAGDEVKFVVADKADFEWALERIRELDLDGRIPVLISPVFGVLAPALLAGWLISSRLRGARLQLQTHKYIWEPSLRGV
jgi:7-carboxy-7-deazaguanine synthase